MSLEQGACSTKRVPFAINPMVCRMTCKDRSDSGLKTAATAAFAATAEEEKEQSTSE